MSAAGSAAGTTTFAAAGAAGKSSAVGSGADGTGGDATGTDPIAAALALLSHSLAGALSGAQATAPGAAGSASDAAAGAIAVLKGSVGQNVASLLTVSAAGDSKDPSNSGPSSGSASASGPTDVGSSVTLNAAAQLSTASQSGTQQTGAPATGDLRNPVATPAWTEELGGHMTWMAHQGIESASLRLSPEHLGPLDIRISVQHGQASVWFGATQADTRTALEQALPRLREMFANQGMTLTDAGVSRDTPKGQQHAPTVSTLGGIGGVTGDESLSTQAVAIRLGLVDTYA